MQVKSQGMSWRNAVICLRWDGHVVDAKEGNEKENNTTNNKTDCWGLRGGNDYKQYILQYCLVKTMKEALMGISIGQRGYDQDGLDGLDHD